jgi:HK97 family phage prohead protease
MKVIERRRVSLPIEFRADEVAGKGNVISGYAAKYYDSRDLSTQYELWDGCYERLQPGCFDSALKRPDDVRCLFNHDPNLIIGRTAAGTLILTVDKVGLRYECTLPETGAGPGVAEAIQRKDVTGCSFSFDCLVCTWTEDSANDVCYRDITDVMLYDVGPVTFPAYESTEVELNSIKRSLQAARDKFPVRRNSARRRLRLLS